MEFLSVCSTQWQIQEIILQWLVRIALAAHKFIFIKNSMHIVISSNLGRPEVIWKDMLHMW